MIKTTLVIFLLAIGLVACDANEQKQTSENKQAQNDVQVVPNKTIDLTKQNNSTNSQDTLCAQKDIDTWFAFDEAQEEPACHLMKSYKLKSFQCEIAPSAFGMDADAIYIEQASSRFFAYPSEKVCREALDIRNSNAP